MSKPDRPCCLTASAGKANHTLQSIATFPLMDLPTEKIRNSGIVYVTTREEVETLNTKRFLASFGPQIKKKAIQKQRGMVHFTIDGYDGTEEALYEIAAVRKYYSRLHKRFPCWLFFGHLDSASLLSVMLSILPNVKLARSKEGGFVKIPRSDVHSFFMESLSATALLQLRAGISTANGIVHLKAVSAYLGIHGP